MGGDDRSSSVHLRRDGTMSWVGMSGIDIVVDVEVFEALPYWHTMSSLGVPPHVSILYPWRRSPLSMLDMRDVENVIDALPAFSISFDAVARLENGTVYAQIGDSPALSALTRTVWRAFPETPPYGGEFAAPAPHVTREAADRIRRCRHGRAASEVRRRCTARVRRGPHLDSRAARRRHVANGPRDRTARRMTGSRRPESAGRWHWITPAR